MNALTIEQPLSGVLGAASHAKPALAARDQHLPGLDGLRGIACLLIFLYHLRWAAGDPVLFAGGIDFLPLLKNCDIGVPIFFALSGLLLSMPFWQAIREQTPWPEYGRYLWRRTCRIVPAYYACLAVVYLLAGDTYTLYGVVDFLLHATFLHTFSDQSFLSHHGVLWTIGIEFQFYLLLPLLMAGVAACAQRFGIAAACLILLIVSFACDPLASVALQRMEPSLPDRFLAQDGAVLSMGTIFHYLKYFAFGIAGTALLLHWRSQRMKKAPLVAAIAGIVGSIFLLCTSGEGVWRQTALTGWPLNLAIFALLAAALPLAPAISRIFEIRPLVFAGEISYGIYLWHELVLKAVFAGTLPGRLHGWALMLAGGSVALAVTALLAWLSYRFLERPAMRAAFPFSALRVS